MKRLVLLFAVALFEGLLVSVAQAAPAYYIEGHADIRATIADGALHLQYGFDSSAIVSGTLGPQIEALGPGERLFLPSDQIITYLNYTQPYPDAADLGYSPDPWAFIGASVGNDYWVIPQVQDWWSGTPHPWLGFSTEGIPNGTIQGNVSFQVNSVSGPAGSHVSMWVDGVFGTPSQTQLSTMTGVDSFEISPNTHAHYNIAFTEPGLYHLDITATALTTEGVTLSDTAIFTFQVVPEPTSASLCAISFGMLGLLARRNRRRM